MKIAAIIPARNGSKRIPFKNSYQIYSRPLINFVLSELIALKSCKIIDEIFISTNCEYVKNSIRCCGTISNIDFKIIDRPEELCDDNVSSEDVISHTIQTIGNESYDYIMLVQCTSPLTNRFDLIKLIESVKNKDSAMFYTETDSIVFNNENELNEKIKKIRLPSQLKNLTKIEAGNAWIFKTSGFLKHKSRLFGKIGLCKIDWLKSLEIDTKKDIETLEMIIKGLGSVQKSEYFDFIGGFKL